MFETLYFVRNIQFCSELCNLIFSDCSKILYFVSNNQSCLKYFILFKTVRQKEETSTGGGKNEEADGVVLIWAENLMGLQPSTET